MNTLKILLFYLFILMMAISCKQKIIDGIIITNESTKKIIDYECDVGRIVTLGKKKYTIQIINKTRNDIPILDVKTSCSCTIADVSSTINANSTMPLYFFLTPDKKENFSGYIKLLLGSDFLDEIIITIKAKIDPLITIRPNSIQFMIPRNSIQSATAVIEKNVNHDLKIEKIESTLEDIQVSVNRLDMDREEEQFVITCRSESTIGTDYGEILFFTTIYNDPVGCLKVYRKTCEDVITIPEKTYFSPYNPLIGMKRKVNIFSMEPMSFFTIQSIKAEHPNLKVELSNKDKNQFQLELSPVQKGESFESDVKIFTNKGVFHHPVSVKYYQN